MPNALLDKEPGYFYGSILPIRQKQDESGKRSGPFEWAVPELLREPANAMLSVGNVARGEASPTTDLAVRTMTNFLGGGALAGGAPKNALGTVRGWHGTPHKFEPVEHNPFGEFRDQAIGTGEGAQVYGFGHYVAGKKGVAEYYKDALATPVYRAKHDLAAHIGHTPGVGVVRGEDVPEDMLISWLNKVLIDEGADEDFALTGANDAVRLLREGTGAADAFPWAKRGYEILEKNFELDDHGHLLEVLIRPDESELLSWDLPLGRQGDAMKERLKPLLLDYAMPPGGWVDEQHARLAAGQFWDKYSQMSGADLYHMLAKNGGDQAASEELARLGIPGIRYWDQGSRGGQKAQLTVKQPHERALDRPDWLDKQHAVQVLNTYDWGDLKDPAEVLEFVKASMDKELTRQVERAKARGWEEPEDALMPHSVTNRKLMDLLTPEMIKVTSRTSNYVIFDPKNLHISARNGERLTPVDHDPWASPSKVSK